MNALLVSIAARVARQGFAFVPRADMLNLLAPAAMDGWPQFATTWDDLGLDTYMADGGRYRRRRYAVYRLEADALERQPHQPHYQSRDYNRLNGGVQRWFEPVTVAAAQSPATIAILQLCQTLFSSLEATSAKQRRVEMHQFRIEPAADETSHPTPEGLHRDGVEWVCVVLVGRSNVEDGVTQIHDHQGRRLGAFTLSNPLDTVFLNDRRVLHGVTGIHRMNSRHPAFRDVFVVTFSRPGGPSPKAR